MNSFDVKCTIAVIVGIALLFLADITAKQIGFLLAVSALVSWLRVRVTGPYLETKKRNGQE